MSWLLVLIAALCGLANPLQSSSNSQLNKSLANPMMASLWVYASGLAALLLIQVFLRSPLPTDRIAASVPWWAWMGGLLSIVSTVAGLTLAQKLGSGVFTAASLSAAMATSVLLDHFGWMGLKQHTASPLRLAGTALMISGFWLIARF